MESRLADTGDQNISQEIGAGSRQRSGDLQCVRAVVVKSLGNTGKW